MLKGKKKALAAQVLLGLMVAGNVYTVDCGVASAADFTINKDWLNVQDGGSLAGIDAVDGGCLSGTDTITGKTIEMNGSIGGCYSHYYDKADNGKSSAFIKGSTVTGNTLVINGRGSGKSGVIANYYGPEGILSNIFNHRFAGTSSDNKLVLGDVCLKNNDGGKNSPVLGIDVGLENDIELQGGSKVDWSGISFSGRNLYLQDGAGTEKIRSANMQGDVTAERALNVTEDLIAGGNITANGGLTAGGNIKGADISTGTSALKGNTITASGDITSGSLDAKDVYANSIAASGRINVAGVIRILAGRTRAVGDVSGASITAGSIVANNVTATSGDIIADSINATGNVTASAGNVTLNSGASNIGGTLQASALNLNGDSSLTVGTLQTNGVSVTSTATGTVLNATTIQNSMGNPVDLASVFTPTQTNKSTALFNQTYGTSVVGSSVQSGLIKSEVREQTKSLVETQMASMALTNGSADLVASAGYTNAAQAVQDAKDSGDSGRSMVPYVAANYGSMRQESGSHVDVKGSNFNIGFAKEVKNGSGKLLFGPMFEYGRGNYDSYLDDGTTGSGTAQNYGIGMMARQTNDNGFYYEGSVRYGKVTSDYSSSNVWAGHDVSYDNSAKYWGAHVGVGKLQKLGGDNAIDLYGKLFYTNQGSSSVNINGDTLDFSSVKSKRSRIGFRYIHGTSDVRSVYAGLAWQYEFDGAAHATANGFSTPSPSVKGSSGMLELGVLIAPKASPVSFDLGVSGWAGKQKGYSLNANMLWSF